MSFSLMLTIVSLLVAAFGPTIPRQGTPDGKTVLPEPLRCDAPARTVDELAALDSGARGGTAILAALSGSPRPLPAGTPADAETTAAVVGAAREAAVCFLAGEPLRGLAFVSDDFLGRIVTEDGPDNVRSGLALLEAFPSEMVGGFQRVGAPEGRRLDDGRVGVVVPIVGAVGSVRPVLFVFVATANGWQLDDVFPVEAVAPGTPMP